MLLRLASVFAVGAGIMLAQCDCTYLGARKLKKHAEVAFRGTLTEFRHSAKGEQIAVFRVSSVWKGPVTATFEIIGLEGPCSFGPGMLKPGDELLVFGSTNGSRNAQEHPYRNIPCASNLIKYAEDIDQLGRGWKPKQPHKSSS